MVTICTTSLTFNISKFFPHNVFMCFVWISEQTAIISLYNINWLVFINQTECVYCAVQTGYLDQTYVASSFEVKILSYPCINLEGTRGCSVVQCVTPALPTLCTRRVWTFCVTSWRCELRGSSSSLYRRLRGREGIDSKFASDRSKCGASVVQVIVHLQ